MTLKACFIYDVCEFGMFVLWTFKRNDDQKESSVAIVCSESLQSTTNIFLYFCYDSHTQNTCCIYSTIPNKGVRNIRQKKVQE